MAVETSHDRSEPLRSPSSRPQTGLLTFGLGDSQRFALDVFQVREVIERNPTERAPCAHPWVAGSFDWRGQTVVLIDLAEAMGYRPLREDARALILVAEVTGATHAFLIGSTGPLIHCDTESLVPPAAALSHGGRIRALTRHEGTLVAVIDAEGLLAMMAAERDDPDGTSRP